MKNDANPGFTFGSIEIEKTVLTKEDRELIKDVIVILERVSLPHKSLKAQRLQEMLDRAQ